MFSDDTFAEKSKDLKEYYDLVYNGQKQYHGADYMLVHDEIKERVKGCESYTEFGVNQGTTLCTALFSGVKKARAVELDPKRYNLAKHHFEKYVKENNVDFNLIAGDTLTIDIEETDVLYIDTRHVYEHLTKELARHGHKAKKYIIFHDTVAGRRLDVAVKEYVQKNPQWEIVTDCKKDVGYMCIGKK